MKKKVIIADPIDAAGIEILKKEGIEVINITETPNEIASFLTSADGVIVRSRTKIREDLIRQCKNLKVIGRAGVGLDNIDVKFAQEQGIQVINTTDAPSAAVAEHTIALMLAHSRNLVFADNMMKQGKWAKKELSKKAHSVAGRTLGLIGCGRIGIRVTKAALALGMNVLIYDVIPVSLPEGNANQVPLDEVLSQADVISCHVPLLDSTKGMVNQELLNKMKPGVLLINTSRGGIINEEDLIEALKTHLGGAALDVYENEPNPQKNLTELHNVLCTPHVASSTLETQKMISIEISEKIAKILS